MYIQTMKDHGLPIMEIYRARYLPTTNAINPRANTDSCAFQPLGLPGLTLEVGREAALRREAARRWRSRHLCSAATVVLVLVLLVAAGALIAWLWTTERRLFRV